MIAVQPEAKLKKIIAWDGEGENIKKEHRLILVANSEGNLIIDRQRKGQFTYREWLPFLCSRPNTINVWFSFGYDVNMMFKDLDLESKKSLFGQSKKTPIEVNNEIYVIKYIPRKILTITHNNKTFTHYDVFGFFQTSFEKTLTNWNITTPEIITKGKKLRSDFTKQELDFIIQYNFAECEKLLELVTLLREAIHNAQIPQLRSWHGAGAIASRFLDSWGVADQQTNIKPTEATTQLFEARKFAYFGGRSELFSRGLQKRAIYQYDINSAYPFACCFIPALHDKQWYYVKQQNTRKIKKDAFGLIHVKWNLPYNTRVGPLPFRRQDNAIIFPRSGEGWYHNIEVQTAIEQGYKLELVEAHILESPYDYFLKEPILDMAAHRLELKQKKDFAHIPIKLGLNSVYGKIAQRPIKREDETYTLGKYSELFWAGFITAKTRSMLLQSINKTNVIMVATDGIFSPTKLKNIQLGSDLGQWEYTEHKNANFLLSGVYALQDLENNWHVKTRGYTNLTHELFKEVYRKQIAQEEVAFYENRFITIKLALKSPLFHAANFQPIQRILNWNNNKKRIFDNIEAPFSDSITTHRPPEQKISKMYNPKGDELFNPLPETTLTESISEEEL